MFEIIQFDSELSDALCHLLHIHFDLKKCYSHVPSPHGSDWMQGQQCITSASNVPTLLPTHQPTVQQTPLVTSHTYFVFHFSSNDGLTGSRNHRVTSPQEIIAPDAKCIYVNTHPHTSTSKASTQQLQEPPFAIS